MRVFSSVCFLFKGPRGAPLHVAYMFPPCVLLKGPVVHPFTWLGAMAPSIAWFVAAAEPPAAVAAAIFAKPKAS